MKNPTVGLENQLHARLLGIEYTEMENKKAATPRRRKSDWRKAMGGATPEQLAKPLLRSIGRAEDKGGS